jgi:hypothetical protein
VIRNASQAGGPVHGIGVWVAPDLAMAAALFSLCYCLFLFEGYQKLFRDSDTGWHIRAGESMLDTRTLPRIDPYSFSLGGKEWFAWEWAADAAMGAVHRAAGLTGVAYFYGLAIAASVWLWFRLHWISGGNFLIACAMAAPMLTASSIHWHARPHVLGWVFLLLAVIAAETRPPLVWVGIGSAIWTNLHGSFVLGPAIATIYAAAAFASPLIWQVDRQVEWRKARWYAAAAGAAALGTLANPYGWTLHLHVIRYLSDSDLLSRIGEYQSFNFHAEGAFQILLTVGIAMLGAAAALAQGRLAHVLVAVLLIAGALRAARGLPLVGLALLPLANGAITQALEQANALQPALRRRLDAFLRYGRALRAIDGRHRGWATGMAVAALVLVALRAPGIAARTGFPPDQFPVTAAVEIANLPQSAKVLAPDKFGGYLIYASGGSRKVFFDGRSDFYGAEFLKRYARMVQVRPGWKEELDRWGFTHALLPNDYSLIPALEASGWKQRYRDGTATLLERN